MTSDRAGFAEVVIRPLGAFRESPPLHFWAMQAIGFLYLAWRFASRDYTIYGRLPDEAFDYPRTFVIELWPVPVLHFTTFQFLYAIVPRPGPQALQVLQCVVVVACLLGALGVVPRACALIAFLLASHVAGLVQSSNAEFDGCTVILCTMLVLALAPGASFYKLGTPVSLRARGHDFQWPVNLLMLFVGAFYGLSGLCKLVDIGPHWPFVLHIERLAAERLEDALFLATRWVSPSAAHAHLSSALSVVAGLITLVCELGAFGLLWLPRQRLPIVTGLIGLHVAVFLVGGINFLGNSAVLLLCLDWNALARKLEVSLNPAAPLAHWLAAHLTHLDWFGRLAVRVDRSEGAAITARDEDGTVFRELHALEEIATRCPALWPLAIVLKIPLALTTARFSSSRAFSVDEARSAR